MLVGLDVGFDMFVVVGLRLLLVALRLVLRLSVLC